MLSNQFPYTMQGTGDQYQQEKPETLIDATRFLFCRGADHCGGARISSGSLAKSLPLGKNLSLTLFPWSRALTDRTRIVFD